MSHLIYLAVLAGCLLATLPLEFLFHARVYRRWRRALSAIVPVAVVFIAWDYVAAGSGWWFFGPTGLVGVWVGTLPLEELLFFLVVPLCAILTLEAVRHLRPGWADQPDQLPGAPGVSAPPSAPRRGSRRRVQR